MYRHSLQFRGSSNPKARYQLQICQLGPSGQILYRAQWDFPTLRHAARFLNKYFPQSQAFGQSEPSHTLRFETALTIACA